MSSSSFVTIDTFTINDLFMFTVQAPMEFASETRAFTGDLHTVLVNFKDQIQIKFPKLTQAQANILNALLQQTGINAFHTVIYGANALVRKWDGATGYAAGYGINDDVQRLRKKIRFKPIQMPHWPSQANFYEATLDGYEV